MAAAKMNFEQIVAELTRAWDEELDGFLGLLRHREFNSQEMANLIKTLKAIKLPKTDQMIDRNLVRQLWFIPEFIDWQLPHFENVLSDSSQLKRGAEQIRELVSNILGYPE